MLASGVSVIASPLAAGASRDDPWVLDLPAIDPDAPHSFAVFYALSQLLTQRAQLDRSLTQQIYHLMLDEPWGAHHIATTYAQLLGALSSPESQAVLGQGQAWFASHVLTTWYLGVYYHERIPPQRVTHTGALMFDAMGTAYPPRFVSGTGYAGWQALPAEK